MKQFTLGWSGLIISFSLVCSVNPLQLHATLALLACAARVLTANCFQWYYCLSWRFLHTLYLPECIGTHNCVLLKTCNSSVLSISIDWLIDAFTACVLRYNGFSLVYVVLLLLLPLLPEPSSSSTSGTKTDRYWSILINTAECSISFCWHYHWRSRWGSSGLISAQYTSTFLTTGCDTD